ncbi:hypothetical protein TNCV_1443581 [Trichonephila clavipes]|nr:hypothetical protein TNCV_1443581 [Trichonephila clavipes]
MEDDPLYADFWRSINLGRNFPLRTRSRQGDIALTKIKGLRPSSKREGALKAILETSLGGSFPTSNAAPYRRQNGLAPLHPNFEGEYPEGWSRASHLSSFPPNLTRGLAARRLFKAPPCREGTKHLQTSMSSMGFEPRPKGTEVSVANHCTGWATYSPL